MQKNSQTDYVVENVICLADVPKKFLDAKDLFL